MKKNIFLLAILIFLSFSCKKEIEPSECVSIKIEAFKTSSGPLEVRTGLMKSGERVYWFVDDYIDGGEPIINENCEILCITDCECISKFPTDCTEFDNLKWETYWKK